MANALSYSLFGYRENNEGYPFGAYIRGVSFNLKAIEMLYPGWTMHLILDKQTYNSPYKEYFDYHVQSGRLRVEVTESDALCMMMLKRMRPVFSQKYDRVLCRDLDSLPTYRERQAVEYWIQNGRVVHAMTDSVSHNISLMGGMIGFSCNEFKLLARVKNFDELVALGNGINYSVKGSDQTFLNRHVLPRVAGSIVEHYLLGLPQSFRGECYNYVQDIAIPDVSPELKAESNLLSEHIGASGFHVDASLLFFEKYFTQEQKDYYNTIEDKFKEIHYWRYQI